MFDMLSQQSGEKAVRDSSGRFKMGNTFGQGHGRPEGSGKNHVKDICWDSINTVAYAIFGMPEPEMKAWYEANKHTLSRAARIYIEASEKNIDVIESLLDRIVGKTLKVDDASISRDPIMERYHSLSPEARKAEIDAMIRSREIIEREYESIRTGIVG